MQTTAPDWPSQEEMAAAEAQLVSTPEFQQFSAMLANHIIARRVMTPDRVLTVDPNLQQRLVGLATTLAALSYDPTASPSELEFGQAMIEANWRRAPVLKRGPRGGPRFVSQRLPKTDPWRIALTHVFQIPMFLCHMVVPRSPALDPRARDRAEEEGRFTAVAHIVKQLAASCLPLPPALEEAAGHLREARSVAEVPWPTRDRVEVAMAFLLSRVGPPVPAPEKGEKRKGQRTPGEIDFRVGFGPPGGRSATPRLSPWGAANRFAECFGVPSAERLSKALKK